MQKDIGCNGINQTQGMEYSTDDENQRKVANFDQKEQVPVVKDCLEVPCQLSLPCKNKYKQESLRQTDSTRRPNERDSLQLTSSPSSKDSHQFQCQSIRSIFSCPQKLSLRNKKSTSNLGFIDKTICTPQIFNESETTFSTSNISELHLRHHLSSDDNGIFTSYTKSHENICLYDNQSNNSDVKGKYLKSAKSVETYDYDKHCSALSTEDLFYQELTNYLDSTIQGRLLGIDNDVGNSYTSYELVVSVNSSQESLGSAMYDDLGSVSCKQK